MYKHHEETINNITAKLSSGEDVLAVIVGGSIAHGFETEKSDVDIMIVIPESDYYAKLSAGELQYYETEACTYDGGYIDGKYTCMEFIKKVMESGSEPARFAYDGAFITYSKIEGLDEMLKKVSSYPTESRQDKINRFYAQFQAWQWYCHEAVRHNNAYLLNHSVSNLILFGGRLILAHNEKLYPYHKWFLRVLQSVERKPETLMENISDLLSKPCSDNIDKFYKCVMEYTDWNVSGLSWPNLFIQDSELNWLDGKVPIADA